MATRVEEKPETEAPQIPDWWKDMKFCHIRANREATKFYCGKAIQVRPDGTPSYACGPWTGLAVCVCGNVICPRCVQLCEIAKRLEP